MLDTGAKALVSSLLFVGAVALAPMTQAATVADMSDADYLAAARCAGLADGSKMDTAQINTLLKAQGDRRVGFIADRADSNRSDAARQARKASPAARQKIDAELSGYCQTYLKGGVPG